MLPRLPPPKRKTSPKDPKPRAKLTTGKDVVEEIWDSRMGSVIIGARGLGQDAAQEVERNGLLENRTSSHQSIPFTSRIDAARAITSLPNKIKTTSRSLLSSNEREVVDKLDHHLLFQTAEERQFYLAVIVFCLSKPELGGWNDSEAQNSDEPSLASHDVQGLIAQVSDFFQFVNIARQEHLSSRRQADSDDGNHKVALLTKTNSQRSHLSLITEPAASQRGGTPRETNPGRNELETAAAFDKLLVALQFIIDLPHTNDVVASAASAPPDSGPPANGERPDCDSVLAEAEHTASALAALKGATATAPSARDLSAFSSLREIGNALHTIWSTHCKLQQAAKDAADPLSAPCVSGFLAHATPAASGGTQHRRPGRVQPDGTRLPHRHGGAMKTRHLALSARKTGKPVAFAVSRRSGAGFASHQAPSNVNIDLAPPPHAAFALRLSPSPRGRLPNTAAPPAPPRPSPPHRERRPAAEDADAPGGAPAADSAEPSSPSNAAGDHVTPPRASALASSGPAAAVPPLGLASLQQGGASSSPPPPRADPSSASPDPAATPIAGDAAALQAVPRDAPPQPEQQQQRPLRRARAHGSSVAFREPAPALAAADARHGEAPRAGATDAAGADPSRSLDSLRDFLHRNPAVGRRRLLQISSRIEEESPVSPRAALLGAVDAPKARGPFAAAAAASSSSSSSVVPWAHQRSPIASQRAPQGDRGSHLPHHAKLRQLASALPEAASIPSPRRDRDALRDAPRLGLSGLQLHTAHRPADEAPWSARQRGHAAPSVKLRPDANQHRALVRRSMYFSVGEEDEVWRDFEALDAAQASPEHSLRDLPATARPPLASGHASGEPVDAYGVWVLRPWAQPQSDQRPVEVVEDAAVGGEHVPPRELVVEAANLLKAALWGIFQSASDAFMYLDDHLASHRLTEHAMQEGLAALQLLELWRCHRQPSCQCFGFNCSAPPTAEQHSYLWMDRSMIRHVIHFAGGSTTSAGYAIEVEDFVAFFQASKGRKARRSFRELSAKEAALRRAEVRDKGRAFAEAEDMRRRTRWCRMGAGMARLERQLGLLVRYGADKEQQQARVLEQEWAVEKEGGREAELLLAKEQQALLRRAHRLDRGKEILLAGMEECGLSLVLPPRIFAISAGGVHVEPLMRDLSNAAAVLVSLLSALVQLSPAQRQVVLANDRIPDLPGPRAPAPAEAAASPSTHQGHPAPATVSRV